MGATSLDAEIQGFLSTGIAFLRNNIDTLDEVFETWTAPHMQVLYGQNTIDQVKRWMQDNEIPVVLTWGLQNVKMPCLSVHLAQEQERVEAAALSDQATMVDNLVNPPVIVNPFTPLSIDQTNGIITVPPGTDLSELFPGAVLVDAKNEEYLIVSPITSTSFAFTVAGDPVLPTRVYVKSAPGQLNQQLRGGSSRSLTHVDVGIHASADYQTVLWLYYIVQYIFFRFKLDMEIAGIQLQTFSGSEFNKDMKFGPENVYSRWFRYSAQTSVEWTEPFGPAGTSLAGAPPPVAPAGPPVLTTGTDDFTLSEPDP